MKRFSTFIVLLIILIGCSHDKLNPSSIQAENGDNVLTISAAISLSDALHEIKEVYEKENNVKLTFNLGGSGKLAQQIQQGAPVDVFISANQDWMDVLEDKGLIKTDTRTNVTGNQLVLITGKESSLTYESFGEIEPDTVDQIAIGNPESVPAGKYTKDVLENLGTWDNLKDKLILAKDVRQVLTYVESGNTDIGFVYKSDIHHAENIKVLATADKSRHDPILYPIAVVADTKYEQEAFDFINFMQSDEAQNILESYGFTR